MVLRVKAVRGGVAAVCPGCDGCMGGCGKGSAHNSGYGKCGQGSGTHLSDAGHSKSSVLDFLVAMC